MAGVNKATILGRLGKDPEIRAMQNGDEVATMSVATSESWKDKNSGERKEKSEWHTVVIFSQGLVNVAKNYLKKGSQVYVEGKLQTRKWQDREGNDRYSTEIVLQGFGATLVMLDGAKKQDDNQKPDDTQPATNDYALDDEIPFAWLFGLGLTGLLLVQGGGVA